MRLFRLNVAQTAGNHNRLVVAVNRAVFLRFKGAEIAQEVRAAEFVVERRAAERAVGHDVQRRGDVFGFVVILLPRLPETGDLQVGRGEARQTGFRARAASRCAFVADFAARARGRARKRGDGGGVVVRFHLHDDVRVFLVEAVCLTLVRIRIKPLDLCAFNHGGIVFIRHHRALRAGFVRVANHAEQRFRLLFAVQNEIGIEDFVAAVFRIGLREHHQFHVGRVAVQRAIVFDQIVYLVGRQG